MAANSNHITLILGGARSGKSSYAQSLAEKTGKSVTFLATAQAFNAATPDSGIPRVLFNIAFLLLLANTMAASPDRVRALRSLLVVFGSAFVVKFVVLSALSQPAQGVFTRAIQMLFEGVTFGSLTQDVPRPLNGYVAFFTLMLYLFGLVLLSPGGHTPRSDATSLSRA